MRSKANYSGPYRVLSLSFPICKIKAMAQRLSRVSLTSETLWLRQFKAELRLKSSPPALASVALLVGAPSCSQKVADLIPVQRTCLG